MLKRLKKILVVMLLAAGGEAVQAAEQPNQPATAFELMERGDQYLQPHARGKVVLARSEKSEGGLVPNVWHILYYDATARMKAVELKFVNGKAMERSHPFRLFSRLTGNTAPLNQNKLKIDSDKALEIATSHPDLKHVKLVATKMEARWDNDFHVVWEIDLYARKVARPAAEVHIGELILSAKDGEVLKNNLEVYRVN